MAGFVDRGPLACSKRFARSMKESDRKVTDRSTCLQHALTPYGRTEEDIVTVDEDNGPDTHVDEGHDAEHITATHKDLNDYETYRRNVRDKLQVEIGVPTAVAKNTMSAMAKLTGEIEESTSDVIDYGLVLPLPPPPPP